MRYPQGYYGSGLVCPHSSANHLVMFGDIGVVYNPLERIFDISAAALASAGEAMIAAGISFTANIEPALQDLRAIYCGRSKTSSWKQ